MKTHIGCGGRVYKREHTGDGWWKYDLCCEGCGREDLVEEEVEEVKNEEVKQDKSFWEKLWE